MEIGSEIDHIQKEPIGEMIEAWKCRVERSEEGSFIPFYIAGPDQKREKIINYLAQQLGIDENNRIHLKGDPRNNSLSPQLLEIKDRVKSLKGKHILIIASGFEKRFADFSENEMPYKLSHSYESTLRTKIYGETDKKFIIVTAIGLSCGKRTYDLAVNAACQSQFGGYIIELES